MRATSLAPIAVLAALLGALPGCDRDRAGQVPPAEGLWGEAIDLASFDQDLLLVQPFSPSNCGYCLFDGEFVHRNYLERNARSNGSNLYQSLFSPQLDVHSYLKHYRDPGTAVITFPPEYHKLHGNGFPMLMAFRSGLRESAEVLSPYEENFHALCGKFWPGQDSAVILTSPYHMATRFVFENKSGLAVVVVPDGDRETWLKFADADGRMMGAAGSVKHESDLSETDLKLNLYYRGTATAFRFSELAGRDAPIQFDQSSAIIGPYRFLRSDVALRACFPNPHNPQRYLVLDLLLEGAHAPPGTNATDYAVWGAGERGRGLLLHGYFRKEDGPRSGAGDERDGSRWAYAESLAIRGPEIASYCEGGICPAPAALSETKPRPPKEESSIRAGRETALGRTWTLGSSGCRFPALSVGRDGQCWCAWEERGDIHLAVIGGDRDARAMAIESDASDSFSPVVAAAGGSVWIFYLNDRDGFYRLYGRRMTDSALSDPVLMSDLAPFDAVTPAAACRGDGRVAVAWSEWRANQRFLQYREIVGGALMDLEEAAIKTSEIEYTNAWYPSLTYDEAGRLWGAWNQHYPSTLGVCSGDLIHEATSVVRLVGPIERNENGGYPSIAADGAGRRWVVWESFGWELLTGEAQRIHASFLDPATGHWCIPTDLRQGLGTRFNQTPRASGDPRGDIWVAWSGRRDESDRWGIYRTRLAGEQWSRPVQVSEEDVVARAPAIATGPDGTVWIAWHEGVGEAMTVRVLRDDAASRPSP